MQASVGMVCSLLAPQAGQVSTEFRTSADASVMSATIEFPRSIQERGSHERDYYRGAGSGKARRVVVR
jgi:hypothetical protein